MLYDWQTPKNGGFLVFDSFYLIVINPFIPAILSCPFWLHTLF